MMAFIQIGRYWKQLNEAANYSSTASSEEDKQKSWNVIHYFDSICATIQPL